jgi:hypothetical protein
MSWRAQAIFDLVRPGWRDEQILRRHFLRMTSSSALRTPRIGGLADARL